MLATYNRTTSVFISQSSPIIPSNVVKFASKKKCCRYVKKVHYTFLVYGVAAIDRFNRKWFINENFIFLILDIIFGSPCVH